MHDFSVVTARLLEVVKAVLCWDWEARLGCELAVTLGLVCFGEWAPLLTIKLQHGVTMFFPMIYRTSKIRQGCLGGLAVLDILCDVDRDGLAFKFL
ncbi:unnamed protein product [Amoebophrya sp. A25]|nr:unnamed protein product [Amoebophrya sp. A25]|eukprot:GSA25T00004372001.1